MFGTRCCAQNARQRVDFGKYQAETCNHTYDLIIATPRDTCHARCLTKIVLLVSDECKTLIKLIETVHGQMLELTNINLKCARIDSNQ